MLHEMLTPLLFPRSPLFQYSYLPIFILWFSAVIFVHLVNGIRVVKAEKAEMVEMMLIRMAQTGQLPGQVSHLPLVFSPPSPPAQVVHCSRAFPYRVCRSMKTSSKACWPKSASSSRRRRTSKYGARV